MGSLNELILAILPGLGSAVAGDGLLEVFLGSIGDFFGV